MENRGKSEKTVVTAFVNDLRFFAEAIVDESNKMKNEAENLSSSWNDPQYDKFKEYIDQLTKDLKDKTKKISDCANKIEERELKEI